MNDSKKRMVVDIHGELTGFKTTTRFMQNTSRPWKFYVISKALVALCFLDALLSDARYKSSRGIPKRIKRIYRKEVRTHLIKSLTMTTRKINTSQDPPNGPGIRIWMEEI
jgi:hypothetical protein